MWKPSHPRSKQLHNNLSTDTAKTVACAIVGSRLDYCNSLLHNLSKKSIQKSQRIQNNLSRVCWKHQDWRRPNQCWPHCTGYLSSTGYSISWLSLISKLWLQGNQLISRTSSIVMWPSDIRVHQPPILSVFHRIAQDDFICFQSCSTYHLEQPSSQC